MPTFVSGKSGAFKLDNATPTLTDITSYISNVDFPREADLLETTTLGATSRTFITGFLNATIALQGYWDGGSGAIDEHMAAILGHANTQTFEYGPEGTASGKVRYTGECRLTRYQCGSSVDGVTPYSADLQVVGAITRNTWP